MFYLLLITLTTAAAEYLYFLQKLNVQRRQILTLTAQNNKLRSKVNKQLNKPSTLTLKYSTPTYEQGYTTDNTIITLSPLDDSPVVYKCIKSVRVNVLYCIEIKSEKWYEVALTVDSELLKGYIKENNIKFIVEETS